MNWIRIVRDSSIVLMLGGLVYFSAAAIEKLSASDDRVFSRDRELADKYYSDQEWERASFHFHNLTEQDPYNSYAWYYQAVCQFWIRSNYVTDLQSQTELGASEEELAQLKRKIDEVETKLIYLFGRASYFLRHRRRSLVNLAMIHAARREWEPALKQLEVYVSEGNLLSRSLENISALGVGGRSRLNEDPESHSNARLHCFPKFWELVDQEYELRNGNENFKLPRPGTSSQRSVHRVDQT